MVENRIRIRRHERLFEVSSGPIKIPAVPDFHNPVFEYPVILPAALGGPDPEFTENDLSGREGPEQKEFMVVFCCDLKNVTDM